MCIRDRGKLDGVGPDKLKKEGFEKTHFLCLMYIYLFNLPKNCKFVIQLLNNLIPKALMLVKSIKKKFT